jgi:lipopolysaccharide biosynthesis regulator YciM
MTADTYTCERCGQLAYGGDHVCPGRREAAEITPALMHFDKDRNWVSIADYRALAARLAEVEAERDRARSGEARLSRALNENARAVTAEVENKKLRAALVEIVAHYKLTSSRNPTMDRMAYEARAALQVKP